MNSIRASLTNATRAFGNRAYRGVRMTTPELPTAVLTARFSEAVRWASLLHSDQSRKGTRIAYVSHLLAVASLVLEDGGDEDEAIAGVLHDAMEDKAVVRGGDPRPGSAGGVAAIVVACSDGVGGPGDERPTGAQRKEAYLAHLASRDLPDGTLRVAAADKLHNARSILTDLREHGPEHLGPLPRRPGRPALVLRGGRAGALRDAMTA